MEGMGGPRQSWDSREDNNVAPGRQELLKQKYYQLWGEQRFQGKKAGDVHAEGVLRSPPSRAKEL